MTNISLYIYENIEEYMRLYPKGQDSMTEMHLSSLWINKKNIVLITDIRDKASVYRPDFSKSVVVFDGGEEAFKKYEKDFEPIVEVKKKSNMVSFIGQEVENKLAVARVIGKDVNGNVMGYILYDEEKLRLNLIMKPI